MSSTYDPDQAARHTRRVERDLRYGITAVQLWEAGKVLAPIAGLVALVNWWAR